MENLKKWTNENQLMAAAIVAAIVLICYVILNKKNVSSFIDKKLKNGKIRGNKKEKPKEEPENMQDKLGIENDQLAEIINSYDDEN